MASFVFAQKSKDYSFLFFTILFAMGIWIGARTSNLLVPIAIIASIFLFELFSKKTITQKIVSFLAFLLLIFSGILLHSYQKKMYQQKQEQICNTLCSVRGKISSIEHSKQKFVDTTLTIKLKELRKPGQWWQKTNATVQLQTKNIKELLVGDTIELKNLFFKKSDSSSFNEYLVKHGITAISFIQKLQYAVLHRPRFSLSRWLWQKKNKLYKCLQQKLSSSSFSLFSSIFLGNRSIKQFSFEQSKNNFKNWGILHFLARSGLHLVIFILLWNFLLTFVSLSYFKKQIFLIFISLLYCLMSWQSISFSRALIVFLLHRIIPLAKIRTNGIYFLLIACFLTLLLNPVSLLFLDFQLSFGLAFALTCFGRLLTEKKHVLKKC